MNPIRVEGAITNNTVQKENGKHQKRQILVHVELSRVLKRKGEWEMAGWAHKSKKDEMQSPKTIWLYQND